VDPLQLLGVFLVLAIWSYLFKENQVYYFAEKTFLSITIAHSFCSGLITVWNQDVTRMLGGEYLLLIPTVLGLSYLLRLSSKYRWISRYSNAIILGSMIGISLQTQPITIQSNLKATMLDLSQPNNIIIIIGALTTIFYYYFMRKPGTISDYIAKIGRGFIMVTIGATAANVILTRQAYLTERINFILKALSIIP